MYIYLYRLDRRAILSFLSISRPEEMADLNNLASSCECSHLLDALKRKKDFDPVYHTATMKDEEEEIGCLGWRTSKKLKVGSIRMELGD